jgi:pimeloyl-ACP methyl ester carboxylesterase
MDGADEGKLAPHLLESGWVIAATSYRREGYILKVGFAVLHRPLASRRTSLASQDAVEDVVLLRERVLKECFAGRSAPRCYAFGTSMGGAVISLLAERHPEVSSFLSIDQLQMDGFASGDLRCDGSGRGALHPS